MDLSLRVYDLSKAYGTITVLDQWNLTINKSERVVIMGPSGSGKTTFLRLAAGLELPTSGKIEIKHQKTGFVFQEPRLIPWRTVKQNLLFVNERGDINGILHKMRLGGFEHYYPSQLSGGMRQRVNLARALIVNPDLLILDEAFTSLDLPVKRSIIDDLLDQWNDKRFTIIMVTHDIKEALYIADRIVFITGRPARIKENI
ncbi:MAG: ABC transporter ATP-binding protein, partial [Syntrophomonadaceae bacterium]|nr:ABC transporter ATP-binding protein [Syntrophomonadaceae bacterium]